MLRPTRLPYGARWHALRSSWRRQLPLVAKILVVTSVIGYFFWNVKTIATLAQSGSPALRSEGRGVAQGLRDALADILAARDSEEAWWLRPQAYHKESGCDFSAAVALFKPEELELNCANIDQLDTGEFVGKGFWREVFKTKWNEREVAVKRVKEDLLSRPDIIPRHVEECASIFSIRNEPNIVGLVGWCKTTVVVDYIPHQLDTLLFESEEQVSVHRALKLARDAARGVAQLHNAPGGPFAHADLQARQFLIDDNGTLKLNDFNRVKYTGPRLVNGVPTSEKCTFETSVAKGKWRSPEEYQHRQLDEKLDIYSLSLVMWAMRARVKPFRMLEREEVYAKVPTGVRPPLEAMSDYPKQMQDLIVRGWDTDPKKRPTAAEMADEIDRILKVYENNIMT
ncbi:TKL protein kinase [Phytophthora nicotianae]|uniref:TKL protein kinase n=2 Tax=Phytophthora nicotianae TaxID=4792 RepID=W2JK68_PHYNI|nr:TKL protein kinase [Phytophthora nicotianae]ETL46855.1 TKL protein kinase [Phytophthora nicotianae]